MKRSQSQPCADAQVRSYRNQYSDGQNEARNALIVQRRLEGLGPREIARQLNLSPGVVVGALNRAGLTSPRYGAGGRGNSYPAPVKEAIALSAGSLSTVAAQWGVDRKTVWNWRRELAASEAAPLSAPHGNSGSTS